ncbi:G2/mitotic-specific cyclin S13-7-like isoform X1 [Canna indica]|uniref:G2/mitotic-specific cyclin S13-7-like isoform X1 n=1 Tax=Canna indica TaxID=4628 RepID=A0AAQ3KYH4_9LILI|nr:G2/mitotic-specific cyclin S13-7-like isoform X1 [Canna indica]
MASRRQAQAVLAHQQPQQRVAPAAGKQKIANAADGKSRRALGDIGNLVPDQVAEGKPAPQINRPITRSYGAQLLAKAQAAAAVATNKQKHIIPSDVPAGKACPKPRKKNVPVKNTEEKITVPVPAQEEVKQTSESSVSCRKPPRNKETSTLTFILTSRSKDACGLTDKPVELVSVIDKADTENQLAVVDYVEDIYKFYKSAEISVRLYGYMDSQVEINDKMRAVLTDWLIEVHHKFELTPEALYLTIYIIDQYLSKQTVLRREFQLVGVSAMLIASKYEEIWSPEVNDFILISDRACSREQILGMEKAILNKLEWNLTVPTPYVFIVRFVKVALSDTETTMQKQMEHMIFFFAELALMQYSMLKYRPSMLAASAVYAARCTLKRSPLWTEALKCHAGFSEQELLESTQILVNTHAEAPEYKLKAVYKKYSSGEFGAVALHPPATKLLEELKDFKN